jgi:PilZ domain
MDKRPETRIDQQIPVRVWGMDAAGRPFFQNANANSISSEGAMLLGIKHPLKAGDIIGIQYGERKARFKVIWATDAGPVRRIEAGVQILPAQHTPWREQTKLGGKAEVAGGKDKRRFVRHKILFPIEIGFEDARRAHLQTNATDIGGRGCYVETMLPLSLGTKVNLTFWMDANKVHTKGVVRTSDPNVGMGIEFTDLQNEVQEKLQQHLEKLNEGLTSHSSAKGASNADS